MSHGKLLRLPQGVRRPDVTQLHTATQRAENNQFSIRFFSRPTGIHIILWAGSDQVYRISKWTFNFSQFEKDPRIGCKDAQGFPTTISHMDLSLPACLKAHPLFHFQLAAPRKTVMKAVAKEHSDVTERLQTQTVNSTL